ncbi:MAG: sugar phosphate isomerase/epimerase [Ruminococcaceae bacterium]|nr:sugar phosphate isomerase/epimerase [Oscillospiraceae bacterium]
MIKLSNNPLAISSSFLPSADYEVLKECKDNGIDMLELSIGGVCPGMENEVIQSHWLKLIDSCKKADIKLWSAHLSFWDPYDIASLDKEVRKKAIERQLDMMRFVRENTDIKIFVIHPSYEPIEPDKRFIHTENAKASIRILADEAERLGAELAVECLPRTCLANTIEDTAKIVSADFRLRVCFDTNHLLTDTNEDFIKAFGDKIITIHVSDYDRINERHLLPYEGVNDWKMIFSLLLKSGYTGPVLFELTDKKGYTIPQIKACYDKLCSQF